jgi:hypothetical protein
MEELRLNNTTNCYKLLKYAEEILVNFHSDINASLKTKKHLISITMNNLGCYYKK